MLTAHEEPLSQIVADSLYSIYQPETCTPDSGKLATALGNLAQLLVKKGVISAEDALSLPFEQNDEMFQ
jgi:hypothetical protein